jgi:ribosomal-protein-serine acetyltransferase
MLSGPRVRLEPTTPRFAAELWEAIEVSLPELRPWLAWAIDGDLASTRTFTEAAERGWGSVEWTFTIFVDDEVAGGIGLNRYEPLHNSAQIGYWLRSDLAGRGLITEAAGLVVHFAFDDLELHRLELRAAPDNRASVRVAEKLGFTKVGTLRHGSRGEGGYHDVLVFDLLEGDERPDGGF